MVKYWQRRKNVRVSLNILNVVADVNKERSKKEKNIIEFGLKESTKETITEKKEEDLNEVNQMCEFLSLQNFDIEGAFRLNSKEIDFCK